MFSTKTDIKISFRYEWHTYLDRRCTHQICMDYWGTHILPSYLWSHNKFRKWEKIANVVCSRWRCVDLCEHHNACSVWHLGDAVLFGRQLDIPHGATHRRCCCRFRCAHRYRCHWHRWPHWPKYHCTNDCFGRCHSWQPCHCANRRCNGCHCHIYRRYRHHHRSPLLLLSSSPPPWTSHWTCTLQCDAWLIRCNCGCSVPGACVYVFASGQSHSRFALGCKQIAMSLLHTHTEYIYV